MARCRIGYLLALLGAFSFFICFSQAFSLYVLILALVFPFFSLAVSLPGMLGGRVRFTLSENAVRRGGTAELRLALETRWGLPVGRLSCSFRCVNLMTGDLLQFRKRASGGILELGDGVESRHCGLVRCEVTKLKVCDLLGIFSLPLRRPEAVSLFVLPLDLPPEPAPFLLGEGRQALGLKPRPDGGPGEDYDLRPYRPGDPLRSVHWKLSSKLDGLVVRETLEPVKTAAVLSYDHFGPRDELDRAFDRLDAVSRALIERERPHAVVWTDPATGGTRRREISSLRELRAFEREAFSTFAPMEGRPGSEPPPEADIPPALVRRLHISGREEPAGEEAGA